MLDDTLDQIDATDPFVYRIIVPSDWVDAQGRGHVPSVDVDRNDGYFHLSPHDQIIETARLYFPPDSAPAVLEFDARALGPELVWEPVPERDGRHFPHLYTEQLPLSAATALIELIPLDEGGFRFGVRTSLGGSAT